MLVAESKCWLDIVGCQGYHKQKSLTVASCRCSCRVLGIFVVWPSAEVLPSEDMLEAPLLNGLLAPFVKPLDRSDSILFHPSLE